MAEGESKADAGLLGRALVELSKRAEVRTDDPKELVDRVPADRLVALANFHRVPGSIYRTLLDLDVDTAAYPGLRGGYQMAALGHGHCLQELRGIDEILSPLQRPWMVVKGPVLVELGYGDPGARLYEDLDLVIHPSEVEVALALIKAGGGHETDLNWPEMVRLRRSEIPVSLPAGMLGDVHWHLLVTPRARARFAVSMDELVERRRTVKIDGMDVTTIDTIDGLLYLSLHGSLSGGNQLVWLKDLDQMLGSEPPDWDELVRRARRYRVDLVTAMQLDRTRRVLGVPVPEAVIDELAKGRWWWRGWRARDRHVGMARWGGERWADDALVAATSKGSVSSAATFARAKGYDAFLHYLRRPGSHPDPTEVPVLYRSVGQVDARSTYLDQVASGAWS